MARAIVIRTELHTTITIRIASNDVSGSCTIRDGRPTQVGLTASEPMSYTAPRLWLSRCMSDGPRAGGTCVVSPKSRCADPYALMKWSHSSGPEPNGTINANASRTSNSPSPTTRPSRAPVLQRSAMAVTSAVTFCRRTPHDSWGLTRTAESARGAGQPAAVRTSGDGCRYVQPWKGSPSWRSMLCASNQIGSRCLTKNACTVIQALGSSLYCLIWTRSSRLLNAATSSTALAVHDA